MNIESILEKANLFNELVVNSGFQRDMTDYHNALQEGHNRNLIYMKDLSSKLQDSLNKFEDNSLDATLNIILKTSTSFITENLINDLVNINEDTSIDANSYFEKFNEILSTLNDTISYNKEEIEEIIAIFSKYTSTPLSSDIQDEQAIVSLIFKDLKTTSCLKEFSKSLGKWNKVLLIYHTILKSDSPDKVNLECIQQGSIDVVFNIDVDVALNLTEVFKFGCLGFIAYLKYKLTIKQESLDLYSGNEELLILEEKKEKLLLQSIQKNIEDKINNQHNNNYEKNDKINKESLDKKVKEIASLITEHIIKGNELKLLSKAKEDAENAENAKYSDIEEQSHQILQQELREATIGAQKALKELSLEDKKILLDKYEINEKEAQ